MYFHPKDPKLKKNKHPFFFLGGGGFQQYVYSMHNHLSDFWRKFYFNKHSVKQWLGYKEKLDISCVIASSRTLWFVSFWWFVVLFIFSLWILCTWHVIKLFVLMNVTFSLVIRGKWFRNDFPPQCYKHERSHFWYDLKRIKWKPGSVE